jgi:two-component system sensor histidine kinase KdpD
VRDVLGHRVMLLLPDANRHLSISHQSDGHSAEFQNTELGVAQWTYEHDQMAGRGTHTLSAAEWTYVPLRTSRGAVGVMGLSDHQRDGWLPEERQLAEAFASQTALALERATLADEARIAWERVEAEFLRNTLLSGVSHELRTPLAGITGAATALIETESQLTHESRVQLLDTLIGEAERMERLINSLLDMTRLESGGLLLKREWQPIHEVIGSTLHNLQRRLKGRQIRLDIPMSLPMVNIDAIATEQVIANLLDNVLEYTPDGSPIEISARPREQELLVEIADHGPGLPAGTENRVFDKFFRAAPTSGRRGIGLGLAICRGIVEAHGGRIFASNRSSGGASLAFTIPIKDAPPTVDGNT